MAAKEVVEREIPFPQNTSLIEIKFPCVPSRRSGEA
jgi:hypothetical protein